MKISKVGKPAPEGAEAPAEHRKKNEQILTDRIQSDLCNMRGDMQAMVPLMADFKTIAGTNNQILYQLLDQMVKAREEAAANTDRVIASVKELVDALSRSK